MSENYFAELYSLDIKSLVEQKQSLDYISWANAWASVKKIHPDATYNIKKFGEAQLPYVFDEATGYMVYTDVTIAEITHEMWLPVMDGANKSMTNKPYTYKVKNQNFKYAKLNREDGKYYDKWGNEQTEYVIKTVDAATMFDINKALMRCLTKNLAMHGFGLQLYTGEDLPETPDDDNPEPPAPKSDSEIEITQAERQLLFKTARDKFGKDEGNEVIKKILADIGTQTTNGMKKDVYFKILKTLNDMAPPAQA